MFAYDSRFRIRDLFFPRIGQYNNLGSSGMRFGVWINGDFSWTDEPSWHIECETELDVNGKLVGFWTLSRGQIIIRSTERIVPETNRLTREFSVENLSDIAADVRLFSSQHTTIRETDIGDTALYDPSRQAMIHYKGDIYLAFGADQIDGYTTGINGFDGLEGTWRDAEDGILAGVPISQGSVDSTFAVHFNIEPHQTAKTRLWIECGTKIDELNAPTEEEAEPELNVNPNRDITEELFLKSLAIVESHCDSEGAIIASIDSDIMQTNRANYAYCWMRDAALASMALTRAGKGQIAREFSTFCTTIWREVPYYQKYLPDTTRGASWHPWVRDGKPVRPCQEDETALPVIAMGEFLKVTKRFVIASGAYVSYGKAAGAFMKEFRDPKTGLPLDSYDLWEERLGVHTFTVATVIAALRALTLIESKTDHPDGGYAIIADEMEAAMRKHLVQDGVFLRGLDEHGNPDSTCDASLLMLPILGVIAPDDPVMVKTVERIKAELTVPGGIARYTGDYYFRRSNDYAGNPWPICSLWMAQYEVLCGRVKEGREILRQVAEKATKSGMLAEQYSVLNGEPLSVMPLTWSHSEYMQTYMACNAGS